MLGLEGDLRTEVDGYDSMIQDGAGEGRGRVLQDPPREGEGKGRGQCNSLDNASRKRENCLLGCRLDGGHTLLWLECLSGSVCHKPNSQSLSLEVKPLEVTGLVGCHETVRGFVLKSKLPLT